MPKITKEITLLEAETIVIDFLEESKCVYDGYYFTCTELLEKVLVHTKLTLSEGELSVILRELLFRGVLRDISVTSGGEITYAIIY